MAKQKKAADESAVVKAGDEIHLVHANGKHLPATVTRVRGGNLVDVEADLGGDEPLVITSAPWDDTGKRADSWHLPESAPDAVAPESPHATGPAPKA